MVEGFTLNSTAGNSGSVGGRRHRSRHGKKGKKTLRLIKKSTARNILKKQGLKMRGGGTEPAAPAAPAAPMGGRRSRKH